MVGVCPGLYAKMYPLKSVAAEKIRAGYPLGKTTERYPVCHNSSATERVGYCYVDWPAATTARPNRSS